MIPFSFIFWIKKILKDFNGNDFFNFSRKIFYSKKDIDFVLFFFLEYIFKKSKKNFLSLILTHQDINIANSSLFKSQIFLNYNKTFLPRRSLKSFQSQFIFKFDHKKGVKQYFSESIQKILLSFSLLRLRNKLIFDKNFENKQHWIYFLRTILTEPYFEIQKIKIFFANLVNFFESNMIKIVSVIFFQLRRFKCQSYRIFQEVFISLLTYKNFFFEKKITISPVNKIFLNREKIINFTKFFLNFDKNFITGEKKGTKKKNYKNFCIFFGRKLFKKSFGYKKITKNHKKHEMAGFLEKINKIKIFYSDKKKKEKYRTAIEALLQKKQQKSKNPFSTSSFLDFFP
jgi:hypothetical protein